MTGYWNTEIGYFTRNPDKRKVLFEQRLDISGQFGNSINMITNNGIMALMQYNKLLIALLGRSHNDIYIANRVSAHIINVW